MIKRFCDKCGKEITKGEEVVTVRLRCPSLLHCTDVQKHFHRDCAIDFIGRETVAEIEQEHEERRLAYRNRIDKEKENNND